jgi:peroxiredoxin Q/BCP
MTVPMAGHPAPDFSATLDDGSTLRLSSLRGHVVILFFYPKDDTGG